MSMFLKLKDYTYGGCFISASKRIKGIEILIQYLKNNNMIYDIEHNNYVNFVDDKIGHCSIIFGTIYIQMFYGSDKKPKSFIYDEFINTFEKWWWEK